jgi:hypothetical protein
VLSENGVCPKRQKFKKRKKNRNIFMLILKKGRGKIPYLLNLTILTIH